MIGFLQAQQVLPAQPPLPASAQIIGLIKSRMSGITLSRHAYADVLRTIWPDLRDATVEEGRKDPCKVNVWAARPMSQAFLDDIATRLTGLDVWCVVVESTTLPDGSLAACANSDQVWVPSSFVRNVCIAGGMPEDKVHVIPYWIPGPPRPRVEPTGPFTVLVSWDGRSSINRKNIINSIIAFKEAWPKDPNVRLKLKTRDLSDEALASVTMAIKGDTRVTVDMRTTDTIDEVFDDAHVLLHIHRAEGYGRHIIEAMQRRMPVIATAYSGPMDWMNEGNAWLVDYRMVETAQKEFQYPQGGSWAEPNIEDAVRHLRMLKLTLFDWKTIRASAAVHSMLDHAELAVLKQTTLEYCRAAMIKAFTAGGVPCTASSPS
jgi:glycosyltransferase involved in cell wall biosynthesis